MNQRTKMTKVEYQAMKRVAYERRLRELPASGGGGCHAALLGVATVGILAGITEQQIFDDLRRSVHGKRNVPNKEIADAVRKAANDATFQATTPRYAPAIDGTAARQKMIEKGRGATDVDFMQASPIRIDWEPWQDSVRLLESLYKQENLLFIGDDHTPGVLGRSIRTVQEWISIFERLKRVPYAKIMPNTLTGLHGPTKDGKQSLRADSCILDFRFVVCEFDTIPIEEQFAFWAVARLPVAAIIHSGKKSLHAWVRIDCENAEEWELEVERKLFPQVLVPLGLDKTCKNESRLSRMPGRQRHDTRKWQRLLYLAPDGRPVHA